MPISWDGEARQAHLEHLAQLGSWEYDPETGLAVWSEGMFRVLGIAPEPGASSSSSASPSLEAFLRCVHEEDQGVLREQIARALRGNEAQNAEVRIPCPDGSERVVQVAAQRVPQANGGGRGVVIGTLLDVTERTRTEQALRRSEERWHLALSGTNDGIWDYDLVTLDVYFSPRWKEMLGYADHEIANELREWDRLVHPDDWPRAMEAVMAHLERRTPFYHAEYRMRHKDGAWRWILSRGVVARDASGRNLRMAGSHTDVTERREVEQQLREANVRLEELATTDGLTGLKNHRAFQQQLGHEVQRARRHDGVLSLLLLDVDAFKRYNDTFGHVAGDGVLRTVGERLVGVARATDLVARYGGEEFALILPETDGEGARAVAERCREAIESAPWPHDAPVTASFGVATWTRETGSHGALIAAADRALYRSKHRGRNRVTHADDAAK